MSVSDGQVVKVSGDKQHPSNFGRLCTKGLTAHVPLSVGRMAQAFVRRQRSQQPVRTGMDQAIAEAARLRAIIDAHGPDAVALYVRADVAGGPVPGQQTGQGLYPHPPHRVQLAPVHGQRRQWLQAVAGRRRPAGQLPGFRARRGVPGDRREHGRLPPDPVPAPARPGQGRGQADRRRPRRSATADKADLFLQLRPGSDLALLNGLLHLLHVNGHTAPDFIARHTEGWDELPAFLADYTPARVAAITGLSEADIIQAAAWIGEPANG
jgi:anaerobic selenocysteine-containing dehydrogenase